MDDITSWINDIQENTIRPSLQSEPEPKKEENQGAVIKVVGTTFDKIVNDYNTDVVVAFVDG